MQLIENKTFKDLTTFHIGGKIRYFAEVKNAKEVDEVVGFAKKNKLPVFIIGGGSDVLVSDKTFEGIAIKFAGKNIKYQISKIKSLVTVEAGKNWDELVGEVVEKNLQGIECLSGIPGSVGASPIQNIGAYGQELKDVFVSLTAYDIEKEKFVKFNKEGCKFGYRESIFKDKKYWQKFVITDVTLGLKKGGQPLVKYDSLKQYLTGKNIQEPTLGEVRDAVLTIRAGKFENPKEAGNAGSFFKNPVLPDGIAKDLAEKYPEIPLREQEDGTYKSSAGWLIEQAGWKGKQYKNAAVSAKHALILLNPEGKATAAEILELSDKIIGDVYKKFGIKLEREVQLINL